MERIKYPKCPSVYANIHLLNKRIRDRINYFSKAHDEKKLSVRDLEKFILFVEKNLKYFRGSWLYDNGKFFVSFLPLKRKIIHPKLTKNYNLRILKRARIYWLKIEKYSEKCYKNKTKVKLSMKGGYYSYNGFKDDEKYFINLNDEDYQILKDVCLKDKSIENRFYAMLAIHYWKDKRAVLRCFYNIFKYPNPWDLNNVGYFLLPLSFKAKINFKYIWKLINSEHQAPITKGLYILNKNLDAYKMFLKKRIYYEKIMELSKWKTPLIKYNSKLILKHI